MLTYIPVTSTVLPNGCHNMLHSLDCGVLLVSRNPSPPGIGLPCMLHYLSDGSPQQRCKKGEPIIDISPHIVISPTYSGSSSGELVSHSIASISPSAILLPL